LTPYEVERFFSRGKIRFPLNDRIGRAILRLGNIRIKIQIDAEIGAAVAGNIDSIKSIVGN
jgi:hypothetical protein